ncbi:MAG: KH domain-containing protein [Candidatus Pacebacteria bacterium]|jgi:predicted RNA-binding protein YlqC (UPF0109 family)|nr:KH domain-containing protein [Candidatus Paceibacterota bacterium]MBP9819067.1 KH domain-containing protein [Candidatus Paceibacterota bacterium]
MQSSDIEFLEYIVKSLVENTDAVKTSRRVDDMGVFIELIVDPADMGKIIGRNGHTAQAIRTIMKAFGKKHQANISIQIKEPAGSTRVAGEGAAVKSVDEAIADLNM